MQCPVCTTQTLQMAERHGIEIDYCPSCRGVWLDRGELDKIIERAGAAVPPPAPVQAPPQVAAQVVHRDTRHLGQRYEDSRGQHGHGYKKKKKESFLSELFDF
ncbi:hypothetical protein C1922_16920 [Stenotrophomonas sp. ZAC14D2_NAIMI4_7]|uniref:TFIIB-type zinc ribbon-containing protein n=1 Tax=Stenotrophomonas sp. ZAC14D2_NAIMI4_7 TaxID=2072405 RepID=UPI000D540445|nr:zf-TFIIB domain-containing protein [Stenotrophomonas sp. ZAC14D2_NAIMI4_7]AWH18869.1 hypothetical protein C1922_16920 [Stenotrophomonas sp. ZAC14D2_NAIMI4_7]